MNDEKIIYHGSHNIIKNPTLGIRNPNKEYLDLAKEWACDQLSGGYANKYSFDTTGLNILNLNSEEFCIIHWISVLLKNRKVTLNSDVEREGMYYILDNFPIETNNSDVIIGYRADDSYFSYARDFLSNAITVKRLKQIMQLGSLGNQVVIKSQLAFSRLQFLGYEVASQRIYYPLRKKRDELARTAYLSNRKGSIMSKDSVLLVDIIRGGIKADDPRLQ